MTRTAPYVARIMGKLAQLWLANPQYSFGQLIEQVENVAWVLLENAQQRGFSARWMNLPDEYLEQAIDTFVSRQ